MVNILRLKSGAIITNLNESETRQVTEAILAGEFPGLSAVTDLLAVNGRIADGLSITAAEWSALCKIGIIK